MPKLSHTLLFDNRELILKGLRTKSIPEPILDVFSDGKLLGQFQGLEIFEKVENSETYPQTVADLISNTYLRLTYQNSEGGSATFGTSLVGCFSMTTSDKVFHLIPKVTKAEVSTGLPHRIKMEIFGNYEDFAEFKSVRLYSICPKMHETRMTLKNTITFLKSVDLNKEKIGKNAMRLFSISSMYSNRDCFDGNLLSWISNGLSQQVDVRDIQGRNRYLLDDSAVTSEFSLLKQIGSKGHKNSPGSPDSPSVRIQITESSIPLQEIGVQGFLETSENKNDDSLSIWAEWIKAPTYLEKGFEITFSAEVSAFPA